MSSRSSFLGRFERTLPLTCSTLPSLELSISVHRKKTLPTHWLWCHVTIRSSCRWWISTSKTTGCTSCPRPSIQSAVADTPPTRRRRWWPGMNVYSGFTRHSSSCRVLPPPIFTTLHPLAATELFASVSLYNRSHRISSSPLGWSHHSTASSLSSLNFFVVFSANWESLSEIGYPYLVRITNANASILDPSLLFPVSVCAAWLCIHHVHPQSIAIPYVFWRENASQ